MRVLANRDYEVYSSVLNTFFGSHPQVSILDRTGCVWRWQELGPEFGAPRIRKVLSDNCELTSDFHSSNTEAGVIENRFSTPIEYTITSSSQGGIGWQLSRVGYSSNGRYALVMVAFAGRPKVASGMLVLGEQNATGWKCEKVLEWCS